VLFVFIQFIKKVENSNSLSIPFIFDTSCTMESIDILCNFLVKDICNVILDYASDITYDMELQETYKGIINYELRSLIIGKEIITFDPMTRILTRSNVDNNCIMGKPITMAIFKNNIYLGHEDKIIVYDENLQEKRSLNIKCYLFTVAYDRIYSADITGCVLSISDLDGKAIRKVDLVDMARSMVVAYGKLYILTYGNYICEYSSDGGCTNVFGEYELYILQFQIVDNTIQIFEGNNIYVYDLHDNTFVGKYHYVSCENQILRHVTGNIIYICIGDYVEEQDQIIIEKYEISKKYYSQRFKKMCLCDPF